MTGCKQGSSHHGTGLSHKCSLFAYSNWSPVFSGGLSLPLPPIGFGVVWGAVGLVLGGSGLFLGVEAGAGGPQDRPAVVGAWVWSWYTEGVGLVPAWLGPLPCMPSVPFGCWPGAVVT